MKRRDLLRMLGCGFPMVGFAKMAQGSGVATALEPRASHFPAKAKHVIFLFLNGGFSHVDTFDPKPMLDKYHDQPMPGPKIKTDSATGNLMRSPYQFRRYGESGIEVSDIFSQVGERIDDFCVIRSTYTDIGNHDPSLLMMNCGHNLAGRPSLGSWLTYGLGTENQNLPGFLVLCPGYPVVGPPLWDSAFLPSLYRGIYVPNREREAEKLLQNIRNSNLSLEEQKRQLALVDQLNRSYLEQIGGNAPLEASIAAMEVAFRMQIEAPEVFDITKEPEHVQRRYGDGEFGRGCLMALRLVEHGVRMVQVYFGIPQPWDTHEDILDHTKLAQQSDGPIAALVDDLKQRGLFEETLVLIGSEFGRTPMVQNSANQRNRNGRDHNPWGFTTLLAGGGVKGGLAYGATDDFGWSAVEKKVHVHDLHATVLHLMGIDHTKLTYRYSGRDFRLTDVHGRVVDDILA